LDAEHDNLRLALDWCLANDVETGLRLAAALSLFWQVRGYHVEGRRQMESLLAMAPARTTSRAKVLLAAGQLARDQADITLGISRCEESLAIFRERGDRRVSAAVLRALGQLASDGGDRARARALFEESLALSREMGDEPGIAQTLGTLGCLALVESDYREAKTCLAGSLALFRRIGDRRGVAVALGNLGHLALDEDDDEEAGRLFAEKLALASEVGNKRDMAYTLTWLGNLARLQGDSRRAKASLTESLTLHCDIGDKRGISYCLCCRGVLAMHQGEHSLGVQLMNSASSLDAAFAIQLTPHERRDCDAAIAAARVALGDDGFERASADGRALSLEQAIAAALAEGNPPVTSVPDASSSSAPDHHGLSRRELDVLRLLATGLTDREIAERLYISRKTASNHVGSILAKLGVSSSRAAAAEAARLGLT
jgi:DNA-binding CsgD family transcriptional regulator/tetratricopeptide (TPR) repeat protein